MDQGVTRMLAFEHIGFADMPMFPRDCEPGLVEFDSVPETEAESCVDNRGAGAGMTVLAYSHMALRDRSVVRVLLQTPTARL